MSQSGKWNGDGGVEKNLAMLNPLRQSPHRSAFTPKCFFPSAHPPEEGGEGENQRGRAKVGLFLFDQLMTY